MVMRIKNKRLIELFKIIKEINANDNIVNVRGGRGYGFGHPYPVKNGVRPVLGPVDGEPKMQQDKTLVKISKAFKNKKRK